MRLLDTFSCKRLYTRNIDFTLEKSGSYFFVLPADSDYLRDEKPPPMRERKIHTKPITSPPSTPAHEKPEITNHAENTTRLAPIPANKPAWRGFSW